MGWGERVGEKERMRRYKESDGPCSERRRSVGAGKVEAVRADRMESNEDAMLHAHNFRSLLLFLRVVCV